MFGNGGLGEGQLANDLTAHARLFPRQQPKNSNSRRMPDSFGEQREFLVRLWPFNGPKVEIRFRCGARAARGLVFLFHSPL